MIKPRYVNEGRPTNLMSSPSMFIGVVIAEEGEIIMDLVLVNNGVRHAGGYFISLSVQCVYG